MRNQRLRRLFLVGAVLSVASCSGQKSESPAASKLPPIDAGGYLACRALVPLMRDGANGTLTDAELRDGIKDIYDKAKVYPKSEVTAASAAALRTLTTGEGDINSNLKALGEACSGWQERRVE